MTTHLHLVPRSKNEWTYTSTPQYAFMAWCSVKTQGKHYLYLYPCFIISHNFSRKVSSYSNLLESSESNFFPHFLTENKNVCTKARTATTKRIKYHLLFDINLPNNTIQMISVTNTCTKQKRVYVTAKPHVAYVTRHYTNFCNSRNWRKSSTVEKNAVVVSV
jgi:hypothetical protein